MSPHFDYSFPQDVLFLFLYIAMYLFIWISFCLHIVCCISACNIFCIFSSAYMFAFCHDFSIIMTFLHDFSSSPMTFKGFTFHFYIFIRFYISPFVLHLARFGSYWMCSFLQHSGFCWYNSYTAPFPIKLACISSHLSFCPSLCKYFHMPPQIWLSHLRISFHALSLTMILSSWSLRGTSFAFVYIYLMLKIKFTSSRGLLGPSLFLIAAYVCKTK